MQDRCDPCIIDATVDGYVKAGIRCARMRPAFAETEEPDMVKLALKRFALASGCGCGGRCGVVL